MPARAAADMAAAARAFRDGLTPAQLARVAFPVAAAERQNWHYVPRDRAGVPFADLNARQLELARALLRAGLSARGCAQVEAIAGLEEILRALEDGSIRRDPTRYYVSLFGEPGPDRPWGWRLEGHHVSVNVTVAGGAAVAVTPSFFGSNPANVLSGPKKGLRVLAAEEDLGRELVTSLDANQRGIAVIAAEAPPEIITGAERRITRDTPAGLTVASFTPDQRRRLLRLVAEYAQRFREEVADHELGLIEQAGVESIHFAWAGGLTPRTGHYYRIQGPTFLIEYDNTQNNANHIHAVWRSYDGDFGEDLLRAHYTRFPDHRDH